MKRAACLLAAALLAAALALPAFAEPQSTTATPPAATLPAPATEAPPETTLAALPVMAEAPDPAAGGLLGAYSNTEIAAFGALGLSLLALLLAVAALARTGKRPRRNAAGNYQKYF